METIRQTSEDTRRPFTISEIRRVIDVADKEWRSLVLFGLYTGQRLADLATLRWDNIDSTRNEIRINIAAAAETEISWFMWSNTGAEADVWKQIAASAHKKDPRLHINFVTAAWNDYWTKLTVQAASGGMQDIISIQGQRTPQFAAAYDFGPYIIFYNRDLFKKENVAEPKLNWAYDDFLAAARKLTHGDQYGFAAFPYPDFFFPFVLSSGANYLNSKGELDLADSAIVKAFENYAKLVHGEHVAPPLAATQDASTPFSLWAAGNAAMYVTGPWDVVNAKSSVKFDFGLATIPKGSKGSITLAAGSGFGISRSAKDRNLAFEAITALTGPEAEEQLASAGRAFPARTDEQRFWYKNAPVGSEQVISTTLEGGALPFKTTANWQQFNLLMVQYGIPVLNGQTSAEEALQQVQAQLGS